jgi:pseudouridine-5'-phosphate glycosidase
MATAFIDPCAAPAGIVSTVRRVPVLAHPVAASAVIVVHCCSASAMSLPFGAKTTSTSPVVRHGIEAWPLFQTRASRLSSNARYEVPPDFSRVNPR